MWFGVLSIVNNVAVFHSSYTGLHSHRCLCLLFPHFQYLLSLIFFIVLTFTSVQLYLTLVSICPHDYWCQQYFNIHCKHFHLFWKINFKFYFHFYLSFFFSPLIGNPPMPFQCNKSNIFNIKLIICYYKMLLQSPGKIYMPIYVCRFSSNLSWN